MGVLSLNGCVKLYTSDIDLSREYTVEFDKDDVNYDGELKIAFNMEFLDKIIANVPEKENLKFKFWAANRSAIINDQYLIMPLMLND
jgi:DNA polymerase III sliding clamp (beta) subunit (PCNA family)